MKTIKQIVLILTLVILCIACNDTTTDIEPQTIERDNFIYILYDGLTADVLESIQLKLDNNYNRVLNDLNIESAEKITVNIWNNESLFLDDMQNVLGVSYPGAAGWVRSSNDIRILYLGTRTDQIVLHEFCHAISLILNPNFGNNPRWLWEAVAIYEANEFVNPQDIYYLVDGDFPTISELNSSFNQSGNQIYQVGYLLSEFIIENWTRSNYVNLIKSDGDINTALGISVQEFEELWKEYVIQKYL